MPPEPGGEQPDLEARVTRLEQQMLEVREDSRAARHLAASADHDIADLTTEVREFRRETKADIAKLDNRIDNLETKIDANTASINALAQGTDENFRAVNQRLDTVDNGLAQILAAIQNRAEEPGNGANPGAGE